MTPDQVFAVIGLIFIVFVLWGACNPIEVSMGGDPCKLCLTLFDMEISCECGANKHMLDD